MLNILRKKDKKKPSSANVDHFDEFITKKWSYDDVMRFIPSSDLPSPVKMDYLENRRIPDDRDSAYYSQLMKILTSDKPGFMKDHELNAFLHVQSQ